MLQHRSEPPPAFVSSAVEYPWDIASALSPHLSPHLFHRPGAARLAHVEIVDAETSAPRMVCRIGNETESWRIDPEDVPTAGGVIAGVIAECRADAVATILSTFARRLRRCAGVGALADAMDRMAREVRETPELGAEAAAMVSDIAVRARRQAMATGKGAAAFRTPVMRAVRAAQRDLATA